MIRRLFLFLCFCLLIGSTPLPLQAQDPASEIILRVNQLRASLGLPAFTPHAALTAAAQSHANWMAANQSYTHTGAGGSSPQDRATAAGYQGFVSENIVGGTNLSPQQGIIWWENSPIHYQTMTSTRHIHVGAGFASGAGQNMYVLVIGVPSDYAPAPGSQGGAQGNVQAETPIIAVPVERSGPREDGSVVHVIQIGQTAWDVAAVYDVDLETLLRLNNLPDDPILLPGDEILVIPGENTPVDTTPMTHRVQQGQSAWAIAARYGLTIEELLWLNGLPPEPLLQPGDELIIRLAPGQEPPPTPTPPTSHIVRSGETLWDIAIRYGLTLDDLLVFNGITQDTLLLPGDELIIRRLETTPTPELPPAVVEVAAQPDTTATPTPTPREAVHATMTALVVPSATPTATLSPTAEPTAALPTPTPTPQPAGQSLNKTLIGAIIIGLGLLALAGMIFIELFERLVRR